MQIKIQIVYCCNAPVISVEGNPQFFHMQNRIIHVVTPLRFDNIPEAGVNIVAQQIAHYVDGKHREDDHQSG